MYLIIFVLKRHLPRPQRLARKKLFLKSGLELGTVAERASAKLPRPRAIAPRPDSVRLLFGQHGESDGHVAAYLRGVEGRVARVHVQRRDVGFRTHCYTVHTRQHAVSTDFTHGRKKRQCVSRGVMVWI